MKVIALLLSVFFAAPLNAGTLKFEFIGGPTTGSEFDGTSWSQISFSATPLKASFTFDVDYATGLDFRYNAAVRRYSPFTLDVSENSLLASSASFSSLLYTYPLVEGGYALTSGNLQLSLNDGLVGVAGSLDDYGGQYLYRLGNRFSLEVNGGQYYYYGDGFWRALYNGRLVGSSQLVPGPVPLPAGLPLMLVGLGGLMFLRRKRIQ